MTPSPLFDRKTMAKPSIGRPPRCTGKGTEEVAGASLAPSARLVERRLRDGNAVVAPAAAPVVDPGGDGGAEEEGDRKSVVEGQGEAKRVSVGGCAKLTK